MREGPEARDAALDAALRPPAQIGVASDWYGHVPFGHWITATLRPRLTVELGTRDGVALAAFCATAAAGDFPMGCVAVPAPDSDPALIPLRADIFPATEALEAVPDGSVDLLHIAAAGADLAPWWRKLSDRAVVLWDGAPHLPAAQAALQFSHSGGLAALAVGASVPAPLVELCAPADPAAVAMRAWFAALGRRCAQEAARAVPPPAALTETDLHNRLARQRLELDRLRAIRLRAERDLQIARGHAAGFRHERDLLLNSTFWRLTYPARLLVGQAPLVSMAVRLRRLRARRWTAAIAAELAVRLRPRRLATTAVALPERAAASGRPPRVVFVSGEPHTPGHLYRVLRPAAAAAAAGASVLVLELGEVAARPDGLDGADLLVVWRAPWSSELARLYADARRAGARIAFDLDDLMLRPELACVEVIDGIRSQEFAESMVAAMFTNIARAVQEADLCLATTEEMAYAMRSLQRPAFVLPNGFDDAAVAVARLAQRARRLEGAEGAQVVRVGYAGGSRTHQRDFAVAAPAVARLLAGRPRCRLVLFRSAAEQIPLLDIEEYDCLLGCLDQIEWRDMVPVELVGGELARFDINLAPLELGNPYCEAKSELKYFEAALVGVVTIASPTGPFARAIRDGETGLLADTEDAWFSALCRLADDPALRRSMAQAAYHAVLHPYGEQRRAEMMWSLLRQLEGGRAGGRAFALDVRPAPPPALPALPETEVMFAADRLGTAEVTVVIPLYNYQTYVEEALDSVARQMLAVLDLVVVDDRSTDRSLPLVLAWAEQHAHRFNRLVVLRCAANAGLGPTRNAGFAAAETPYVLPLDADNRLRPACCGTALEAIRGTGAAFAYPRIQCFGQSHDIIGGQAFLAMRLVGGNIIDAMALVAKWAWAAAGGYRSQRLGWEDYEFWCRLAERGHWGLPVNDVLAEYRVHGESMLHRTTEQRGHKRMLADEMQALHPWLSITLPEDPGAAVGPGEAQAPRDAA